MSGCEQAAYQYSKNVRGHLDCQFESQFAEHGGRFSSLRHKYWQVIVVCYMSGILYVLFIVEK